MCFFQNFNFDMGRECKKKVTNSVRNIKSERKDEKEASSSAGAHQKAFQGSTFYVYSFPIILTFQFISIIACYIWMLLVKVYTVSVQRWSPKHLVTSNSPQSHKGNNSDERLPMIVEFTREGRQKGKATSKLVESPRKYHQTSSYISLPPPEPVISMQKRHHRKAFEYLSRALKLDNEDRGGCREN